MQDLDAPPVEEGETGGGVVAVPLEAGVGIPLAAINSTVEFTARRWTIVTAPLWPAEVTARAPDDRGPALPPIIRSPNLSRCRFARTLHLAFLPLWMNSSFRLKSKKPRAN